MELIFWVTLAVLFIIACAIGVIALYLLLKNWAWEVMSLELPPKKKPQESYWETLEDSVTPTYVCDNCGSGSDKKYAYCHTCGMRMRNYEKRRR